MRKALIALAVALSFPALAQEGPVAPPEALSNPSPAVAEASSSLPAPETRADLGASSSLPNSGVQSMYRLVLRPGALNRISFEVPFVDIVMSPDVPLASQPTKLRNNQTVILELTPDARGDYQAIAQLSDGSLVELILRADPGAPPLSWTQPPTSPFGVEDPASREPIQRREDAWFKKLFYSLVMGEQPEDFIQVEPPAGGQVGYLRADYVAAFRNEDYVVLVARLYSKHPAWIAEQDLYVDGVKAVLLDGQRVGDSEPPTAYIVMAAE